MSSLDLSELKEKAKTLYHAGFKISQIADELGVKPNTVYSWKSREEWENSAPIGRVEQSLENRLCYLIGKDEKTANDAREIDLLFKQMEKLEKIKQFGRKTSTENRGVGRALNGGRSRKTESNAINDEQMLLLKKNFLREMFDYQKIWFEAGKTHRIRNILKSRQIGATYYFAHEALIRALDTGNNQIFLSASKKQALNFRSYIVNYAKRVADVDLKGETIKLPNGAELIFLGTNAATAQSYHGDLYFDEIFWTRSFDVMRKVASAMASQAKYRQTYFSTPTTKAHPAYDFWSGKAFNKNRDPAERIDVDISHDNLKDGKAFGDGQWRQIVNIFDAQARGCNLFDIDALKLEYSPDEFAQLFLCEFADDDCGVFRFADLQNCLTDSLEEWLDYRPTQARPFGNNEVWLGYDPALSGDRSALAIIAPPKMDGGIYRVLHVQTYHGEDFAKQACIIKTFCDTYNVQKISIDATGMGEGVYQEVKRFRPDAVPVKYSQEKKTEMVMKTKNLIAKHRLQFDAGANDVISSFLTIKKLATRSGRAMTYVSDRTAESSHGDIAWAIMNALLNVPYGEASGYDSGSTFFTFG